MTNLTDDDIAAALESCAAEPVRIPGHIQPFGCILVCDAGSRVITQVSDNAAQLLGADPAALLGQDLASVLGRELWHDVKGALAGGSASQMARSAGAFVRGETRLHVSAYQTGDRICVELQTPPSRQLSAGDALKTMIYLSRQMNAAKSQDDLHKVTVETLRHITGYERVMVYKFDAEFNGEVIAEACSVRLDPLLGLRFPHWDIPPQARAVMAELPLRVIADVNQPPADLITAEAEPPLDLTQASCRGVAPIHMQYLRNMGLGATMTVTVMQGAAMWGILAFHHSRPWLPHPNLCDVLVQLAQVYALKLQALAQENRLGMVAHMEALKGDLLEKIEGADLTLDAAFAPLAEVVSTTLKADGVAIVEGGQITAHGDVPGPGAMAALQDMARQQPGGAPLRSESLAQDFPELAPELGAVAGVLAVPIGGRRSFFVFRNAISQSVSWAGNPEKTVETVDGNSRLAPRGSFSIFLEEVEGRSMPWTDEDLFFAEQIWAIVNASERQVLARTLDRQQKLMISELNHRVRNIMALVRSVSQQARRRYGTLESYSKSLEARIEALASAHDLAAVGGGDAVWLHHLISREFDPFGREDHIHLTGPDRPVRADLAPIVSLVLHELVTNANKYGGLSAQGGMVRLDLSEDRGGVRLEWRESGGPVVAVPAARGFGTILIDQAVHQELGGTAELDFDPYGLRATIWLPPSLFDADRHGIAAPEPSPPIDPAEPEPAMPIDLGGTHGVFMIVEDNVIIADELRAQLQDMGAANVDVFFTAADALAFLEDNTPVFACLDVKLGKGETSAAVAQRLMSRDVPFVFTTGYGEDFDFPDGLAAAPRLIKPVGDAELRLALDRWLKGACGKNS